LKRAKLAELRFPDAIQATAISLSLATMATDSGATASIFARAQPRTWLLGTQVVHDEASKSHQEPQASVPPT
jgi:hypothetical protein